MVKFTNTLHPTYLVVIFVGLLSRFANAACQSCLIDLAIPGIFKTSAGKLALSHHGNEDYRRHEHSSFKLISLHSAVGIPFGNFLKQLNGGAPALSAVIGSSPMGVFKLTWWKALDNIKGIDLSVLSFLVAQKVFITGGQQSQRFGIQNIALANDLNDSEPGSFDSMRQKFRRWKGMTLQSDRESELKENSNNDTVDPTADAKNEGKSEQEEGEFMSSSMIIAIGFYKKWISPLLPPACRFLPTCSQYGVQAIQEFGPTKGLILTAWRLARCSPFGGRGYDPPKWPPVPYTYGSY